MPQGDTSSGVDELVWLAAVVSLPLSLGCLIPIFFERTVVLRPEVEYRIEEAQSGDPVEGVTVELCRTRIGPPPTEQLDTWRQETDADGEVEFSYLEETENYQPLMMHGKSQRRWNHCLHADDWDGYRPAPDADRNSSTYLATEEMSYDPEKFGQSVDPVVLQVRDGDDASTPDCPCTRDDASPGESDGTKTTLDTRSD